MASALEVGHLGLLVVFLLQEGSLCGGTVIVFVHSFFVFPSHKMVVVDGSGVFGEVWEIFQFDDVFLTEGDLKLRLRVGHGFESVESLEEVRSTD